jgi:hypothetical protein
LHLTFRESSGLLFGDTRDFGEQSIQATLLMPDDIGFDICVEVVAKSRVANCFGLPRAAYDDIKQLFPQIGKLLDGVLKENFETNFDSWIALRSPTPKEKVVRTIFDGGAAESDNDNRSEGCLEVSLDPNSIRDVGGSGRDKSNSSGSTGSATTSMSSSNYISTGVTSPQRSSQDAGNISKSRRSRGS